MYQQQNEIDVTQKVRRSFFTSIDKEGSQSFGSLQRTVWKRAIAEMQHLKKVESSQFRFFFGTCKNKQFSQLVQYSILEHSHISLLLALSSHFRKVDLSRNHLKTYLAILLYSWKSSEQDPKKINCIQDLKSPKSIGQFLEISIKNLKTYVQIFSKINIE